jgi:methyl-accepting chemotaxis protein
MGNGLDLYGFIDEILDSTKLVLKQIEMISSEIEELDQKIHSTNDDMGRIFQIVTQLANQEVSLMDDVGKTSEEIRFMFDVVNTVIFEIDSRNENMKNLVQMSRTGGEKVQRTNTLIRIPWQRCSSGPSLVTPLLYPKALKSGRKNVKFFQQLSTKTN